MRAGRVKGSGASRDGCDIGIMAEDRNLEASSEGLLRILATTDLHSNLLSYDYFADRADPGVGLSRVASLIAKARQEISAQG